MERGKQFRRRRHQELEAGQIMAKFTNMLAIASQFPWYFWVPRNPTDSRKVYLEHKTHRQKQQKTRMERSARAIAWRALNAMLRYFAA